MVEIWKCDKCGKEFESRRDAEKHEKNCGTEKKNLGHKNFIDEEQYKGLSLKDKQKYVKEWACKCNNCGKTWAYLDKVEKEMRSQIGLNACVQTGSCCNPCVGVATSNANTQLSKQIKELKQCPNCRSSNVKCEARYFRKQ